MIRSVRTVKRDFKMTFQGGKGWKRGILRLQEDNRTALLWRITVNRGEERLHLSMCLYDEYLAAVSHTLTHTRIEEAKFIFHWGVLLWYGSSSPFNYPYRGIYIFLNESYLCSWALKDHASTAKWSPLFIHRSEMIVGRWSNYPGKKNLSPLSLSLPHSLQLVQEKW